jgi:hypothetical protein
MRRSITIVEPLHRWIQHIRGYNLQETGEEFSYTGALNYYLAIGLCTAAKMKDKERENFIKQVFESEEIAAASIEDEYNNLWLEKELPKLMAELEKKNKQKKRNII